MYQNEHYAAQDKRLAVDVDKAVDEAVEELQQFMFDSKRFKSFKVLETLAMASAGVTPAQLEYMSENDDNNPKYTLYWSKLTGLYMKVLGRTIDKNLH